MFLSAKEELRCRKFVRIMWKVIGLGLIPNDKTQNRLTLYSLWKT